MKLLDAIRDALTAAGLTTVWSHPATAPGEETLAAVELESLNYDTREAVVQVTIASPGAEGGKPCREAAVTAGLALSAVGGSWSQGACHFQGCADRYLVELRGRFTGGDVLEQWQGDREFLVYTNDTALNWATAFRAEQSLDEATGLPASGSPWLFRLEENYPWNQTPPAPAEDSFTLKVSRTYSVESYKNCQWVSVEVESTATGLRQIRQGVAQSRSVIMLG